MFEHALFLYRVTSEMIKFTLGLKSLTYLEKSLDPSGCGRRKSLAELMADRAKKLSSGVQ